GVFTGRPIGKFCFRDEKLIRLTEYCHEKNYALQDVYYYADSIDDAPVFLKIGHPVCVSPDKKLSKLAFRNGWPVHQWK
ncbi:MAG: haloacid dehalogenase-like hydrolase, partial [Prolixibacteraceae bacterium]|nr:haloacid dehalogenase-like hydrolase [Prolixibacteraceae bacterium]